VNEINIRDRKYGERERLSFVYSEEFEMSGKIGKKELIIFINFY